jgi:hypothetical protein
LRRFRILKVLTNAWRLRKKGLPARRRAVLEFFGVSARRRRDDQRDEWTYAQRYIKCGKSKCRRCADGAGHGPYWYAFRHRGGRTQSKYVGRAWRPIDPDSREEVSARGRRRQTRRLARAKCPRCAQWWWIEADERQRGLTCPSCGITFRAPANEKKRRPEPVVSDGRRAPPADEEGA